jgi:RHS repeat-associated protein
MQFNYTGEALDTYIKLLFLRARYMQPTLSTFLSRDPWSGDVLRPASMNVFSSQERETTHRFHQNAQSSGAEVS